MIMIMIVVDYDSHSGNDCGVVSMMTIMYIMMIVIIVIMITMMIKMMVDGGCDDHNYNIVDGLLC